MDQQEIIQQVQKSNNSPQNKIESSNNEPNSPIYQYKIQDLTFEDTVFMLNEYRKLNQILPPDSPKNQVQKQTKDNCITENKDTDNNQNEEQQQQQSQKPSPPGSPFSKIKKIMKNKEIIHLFNKDQHEQITDQEKKKLQQNVEFQQKLYKLDPMSKETKQQYLPILVQGHILQTNVNDIKSQIKTALESMQIELYKMEMKEKRALNRKERFIKQYKQRLETLEQELLNAPDMKKLNFDIKNYQEFTQRLKDDIQELEKEIQTYQKKKLMQKKYLNKKKELYDIVQYENLDLIQKITTLTQKLGDFQSVQQKEIKKLESYHKYVPLNTETNDLPTKDFIKKIDFFCGETNNQKNKINKSPFHYHYSRNLPWSNKHFLEIYQEKKSKLLEKQNNKIIKQLESIKNKQTQEQLQLIIKNDQNQILNLTTQNNEQLENNNKKEQNKLEKNIIENENNNKNDQQTENQNENIILYKKILKEKNFYKQKNDQIKSDLINLSQSFFTQYQILEEAIELEKKQINKLQQMVLSKDGLKNSLLFDLKSQEKQSQYISQTQNFQSQFISRYKSYENNK
ncbi:hypothetical protein PPERSA_04943 [Pseudocohnilembus persalinus]|uniref:DUF4200 domain-containing protein n=1 Tax=Pseudocohnilembus persalinus TaxID=266149 RepID=A0A0V0QVS6_PSEPJ|nr:hypothetical protein PPERSA_04943 [Pseudocohnilembus persalinus]|eukprot:KRX06331.1 hypothetical protein PPERSA_04943 [Pseudocohnilembus persalinus]